MCGLAGILVSKTKKPRQDMAAIGNLFTRLLLLSEHRGPLASGVAWMDASGSYRIHKAPESASCLVANAVYAKWMDSISPSTVLLMGHARWPTQGSHLVSHNNHPLVDAAARSKPILLTHNGNIPQVTQYFKHFSLPRRWGVDSEVLVRLARRHAGASGIDVPALLFDMGSCEGHIAAVLAWAAHPETVILIRRDRPLWLAWHARRRLLACASERIILAEAVKGETGWLIESMDEGTALVFSLNALPECLTYDFE